jgi:signal transduction histidine kinase
VTEQTTSARIEVHPSVLFKLGEDLITDEVQAVAELVKNAYDADSDNAVVRIVTTRGPDDFPDDKGYVEVIDRGHGMTLDDIRRGWLTVSNSLKLRLKQDGGRTRRGRTPLGDKGLGRLGAQRLGHRLTITTTPVGEDATYTLSFDWRMFRDFEQLSDVNVEIHRREGSSRAGTTVLISDLRSPERLAKVGEVEKELSKIISPYKGVDGFKLYGSVDGTDLDLSGLETKLRNAAVIHYDLIFDEDDKLTIGGRMRLAGLRPNSKQDRAAFDSACESNEGEGLLRFLQQKPEGKDYQLRPSSGDGWWAEFETVVELSGLEPRLMPPAVQLSILADHDSPEAGGNGADGLIASPGPFLGEIDSFNLGAGAADHIAGFGSLKELREQVTDLAGVRIYRDGFNIRTDGDWLGLGKGWTSGGSWYGLRPSNTLGYLALSARDNVQLVETTDREGFSRTPHYENFVKVMESFVDVSHKVQEFIGRGAVDYRKKYKELAEGSAPQTARDMTDRLGSTLAAVPDQRANLERVRKDLEADRRAAEEIVQRARDLEDGLDDGVRDLIGPIRELGQHAASGVARLDKIDGFIAEVESQQRVGERLQGEFDSLEDQLSLTYETMGVGLIAEALSHEIANITDRLARRTSEVTNYLDRVHPQDRRLIDFVEHVRSSISGLRRQIAHLAPSMRYVRERRERFTLSGLLGEVVDYFTARWDGEKLSVSLKVDDEVAVFMNRGKAIQVFDNLLLNSEYWLREEVRLGRLERGEVSISAVGASVRVADNGRGVDPQIEHSLFQPFTTRKPRGRGRGLGLFIVERLLETDGCAIALLSDRNPAGRRYIFNIDLGAVVVDDE